MAEDIDDITRQALRDLGLLSGASATQIRHAFAQLALKHHPDHNQQDPSATARFQRICRAYEALTHPRPRHKQAPAPAPWPANGPYTWPPWGTPPPAPSHHDARPDPDLKNYPSAADLAWLRSPHPYVLEKREKAFYRWMLIILLSLVVIPLAALAWSTIRHGGIMIDASPSNTYPERFWRAMKRF